MNDEWVGDVMACTVDQARAAAAEADIAAQMARVFEVRGCGWVGRGGLAGGQWRTSVQDDKTHQQAPMRHLAALAHGPFQRGG